MLFDMKTYVLNRMVEYDQKYVLSFTSIIECYVGLAHVCLEMDYEVVHLNIKYKGFKYETMIMYYVAYDMTMFIL